MDLDQFRIPSVGPLGGVNQLYGLSDLIREEGLGTNTSLCEIGTYTGVSASLFAETCGQVVTIDQRVLPGLEDVVARYDNLQLLVSLSEDAVKSFDDETFDVVYIDADHSYESVKRDIASWRPKVKRGGVLCGHDYVADVFENMVVPTDSRAEFEHWRDVCRGVRSAVDESFPSVDVYSDSSWAVRLND
jgi:predicted O-methyltransferase YrrM